jgi:hypothetical protein
MRLIYYSVVLTSDGKYDRQWIQSIRSLRRHNTTIAVWLFVFNGLSEAVMREAARWQVAVYPLGGYREWMESRPHSRGAVLAQYPTLHNLLVLSGVETRGITQALYVDCDTFFYDDPLVLFERCNQKDFYAREVPGSRLSPYGCSSNIDEDLIAQIARDEALCTTLPFNTGVCLLSCRALAALKQLQSCFLDYAWRLMVGMQKQEHSSVDARTSRPVEQLSGLKAALEKLRAPVMSAATPADFDRSLPYPSDNWWILDEIAWQLALGKTVDFTQQPFTLPDVTQGDEFIAAFNSGSLPVIVHYFSSFEEVFFQHNPAIEAN